jgi:hypothetical protein
MLSVAFFIVMQSGTFFIGIPGAIMLSAILPIRKIILAYTLHLSFSSEINIKWSIIFFK